MNLKAHLILFITFLFFFGLASAAFAGGAVETIDPRNGCFANPVASANDHKLEADFINHRGKYTEIVDQDRFNIFKQCWELKALCVSVNTVCRKDGNVVYAGSTWLWRVKK